MPTCCRHPIFLSHAWAIRLERGGFLLALKTEQKSLAQCRSPPVLKQSKKEGREMHVMLSRNSLNNNEQGFAAETNAMQAMALRGKEKFPEWPQRRPAAMHIDKSLTKQWGYFFAQCVPPVLTCTGSPSAKCQCRPRLPTSQQWSLKLVSYCHI